MSTLPTPKVRTRDILAEAIAGVLQRPGRSVLTAFGTVLGVAVIIVVLGLTSSASAQISSLFDPVAATEVSAVPASVTGGTADSLPLDSPERAMRLNGVRTAGFGYPLIDISGLVAQGPTGGVVATVLAASPGFLDGAKVETDSGTTLNSWQQDTRQRVALLGPQAGRAIGYGRHVVGTAIWIDGVRFEVGGVITGLESRPELLTSVVIPVTTARELYPSKSHAQETLWLTTDMGAAQVVGDQLGRALDPGDPTRFQITAPPDPSSLRDAVVTDLTVLFLLLGAVCLIVGMVSIANTTFVAVIERTPEIGLRRAIGARPGHITTQFLVESTLLGLLGGLVGSSLGVLSVVVVCVARDWTAVLDWRLAVAGPLLGAFAGIVAGVGPAWRAARIEPITALRA